MRWPWQRRNLIGAENLVVTSDGRLIHVTQETALKLSAVYRCVTLIAGAIAASPVLNAPPSVVMLQKRGVNAMMSWYEWMEWMVIQMLCKGDGLSVPQRDGRGGVTSLSVHDAYSWSITTNGGSALPTYVLNRGDAGLDPTQVIHFRAPVTDGLRGVAIIKAGASNGVQAGIASDQFATDTFTKEAIASHTFTWDDIKLYPDVAKKKQLAKSWKEEQATGNAGRGKALFAPPGAKVTATPINAEQMQLIEARGYNTEDIARAFGVPSVLINQETKATSFGSGVEMIGRSLVSYTLQPHVNRLMGEINRKLDTEMELDLRWLTRGSQKDRYEAYAVATGGKPFANVETIQEMEGLPVEEVEQPEPPQGEPPEDEGRPRR